jgi:ABC-type transporter Mla subunit MlaD
MNADGTRPVVADLSAAVTAPALRWVWIGLFIGAGLALLIGAVLVAVSVPRRSAAGSR